MDLGIKGKWALVGGASKGLGLGCATALAQAGVNVVMVSRGAEALEASAAKLRALGVTGRIKSPSYAVLEPHRAGDLAISHFDFYRFSDPREWTDAGFRDLFAAPGLKLAEWPEKAAGQLPAPDLRLEIAVPDDDRREVDVQAFTPRGAALLEAWR